MKFYYSCKFTVNYDNFYLRKFLLKKSLECSNSFGNL